MDEFVVGFDRTTLRPTLDLAKARARLAEIGQTRSMSSVLERAKLLAACGELEQAASLAAECGRAGTHFGSAGRGP